jgi:TaqI-like C-terminal specificity domain/Eco57I restriction-modification methylase
VTGGKGDELFEFKADEEIRQILSKNIFGVDINAASVEIARLALWLHTAKSDQPLSNLETNIVEGNSLVGSEVFDFKKDLLTATAAKKETINAFDYEKRFKAVFDPHRPGGAGFDCVVSNPPYVKLQNFKKVYPETADFLRNATTKGGGPRFQSCQTGNFDLYLPFIERGLELLNPEGRLGYIAPSLWRYNEYGDGLRKLLHAGGCLDRWIDFGSFQVFDEAIIYTALQFYSRPKNERVRFALAPTGEVTRIHDWDDSNWYVTYKELPKNEAWIFVARPELALINKLAKSCRRLDDRPVTRNIFVGIQTSADHIYHLERVGKNRYRHQPPKPDGAKTKPPFEEVSIEDAIMHPIVSGQEVHRYQTPTTNTFILFPYEVDDRSATLMSAATLKRDYPLAWGHLKRFEKPLRARESNAFDDDDWYRFGRNQNIDKQEIAKILVPRLCLDLAAVNDGKGQFFIDNVDVGGIEVADGVNADFLTGLLNSTIVNFVWKRIAKPFQNGYLSANKQFIAPLPIPAAKPADIAKVVALSKKLTELHTTRRNTLSDLERRLAACEVVEKPAEWLWPSEVSSVEALLAKAPKGGNSHAKVAWSREQRAKQIELAAEDLQGRLRVGASLEVELLIKGELRLKDEGTTVLEGVFVDAGEAKQIAIDWRSLLRGNRIRAGVKAADFARQLRCIHRTDKAFAARLVEGSEFEGRGRCLS